MDQPLGTRWTGPCSGQQRETAGSLVLLRLPADRSWTRSKGVISVPHAALMASYWFRPRKVWYRFTASQTGSDPFIMSPFIHKLCFIFQLNELNQAEEN